MTIILQILGACIGSFSACLVFEAPRTSWTINALLGGIGWAIYLYLANSFSVAAATYMASLIVAIWSHLNARWFKAPVTVFFIPAFFPFVPGAGMYRTVYAFINSTVYAGLQELIQTLAIAIMIALAIFTSDAMFKVLNQYFPIKLSKSKS